MIRFQDLLWEDERSDRVKRKQAAKIIDSVLEYIRERGRDAFDTSSTWWKLDTSDIEVLPDHVDFLFKFAFLNDSIVAMFKHRGYDPLVRKHFKPEIKLGFDPEDYKGDNKAKIIYQYLRDNYDHFVHEFTHYLDDKRIDVNLEPTSSKSDEEYHNDPRELNAHYQQAVFKFSKDLRNNPDKFDELSGFSDLKDIFFDEYLRDSFVEHLTNENKERIIKRLYGFYEETIPKIRENDLENESVVDKIKRSNK